MLHRFFSRLTPLGGQSLRKSLVALCFLIPLLTQAQNQHRFEGPVEVARWITTHFAQGKLPPFSFYYNERPSAEFIRKWQYKAEKLASDDPAVLRYLYTYRDPATGLLLECQVKGFTDFQAVEWVIKFTNTSSVNTPKIRDVKVVDLALEDRRTSGFDLLYLEGVHCFGSRSDFRPHYTALEPGKSLLIHPDLKQGRSSDETAMPFFNLVSGDDCGVITALGWTGTWSASFTPKDKSAVTLRAGMHTMNLLLYPQETIRTPSVCLLFWQGRDLLVGQNAFRRFVLKHHARQLDGKFAEYPLSASFNSADPAPCTENCCTTEDYALAIINRYKLFGLKPEVFWLDAGWYQGCGPAYPGYDWGNLGAWIPDSTRFPRGLRPVSDAVHAAGAKFLVWFEPERVMGNLWAEQYPEFMSHRPDRGYYLFDLGNPEAVSWLCQYIGDFIEESGIDIYRQDCCIYPAYWWRANDTPDRIGISEIRHIEGLYAYWDYLLERFPRLLIDNCAGGGCRLDLETISRSAPLWRSDHAPGEPEGAQCHAYGINLFLPLNGTGMFSAQPYEVRSSLSSAVVLGWQALSNKNSVPDMQKAMECFREMRPYYYEDYYPLTGFGDLTSDSVWMAYQLNKPSDGSGVVLAFRRGENPDTTLQIHLQGLDPEGQYEVYDTDSQSKEIFSGSALAQGLTLRCETAPGSLLLRYRRLNP